MYRLVLSISNSVSTMPFALYSRSGSYSAMPHVIFMYVCASASGEPGATCSGMSSHRHPRIPVWSSPAASWYMLFAKVTAASPCWMSTGSWNAPCITVLEMKRLWSTYSAEKPSLMAKSPGVSPTSVVRFPPNTSGASSLTPAPEMCRRNG